MRGVSAVSICIVLSFGGIVSAFAHATVVNATPSVGGSVSAPPAEVTINFSEKLETTFSAIVVRDAVGKRVDKNDAHVDGGNRAIMRVSLPPLPAGAYIVQWRALTADTHRTDGAFIFRVGN
jgi:methionine-rich copper-binding protein CopC